MIAIKQRVGSLVRKLGLIDLAEITRYQLDRLRVVRSNRDYIRNYPAFVRPPARLLYEVTSSANYRYYAESGIIWAKRIYDEIERFGKPGPLSVCEWGCGVGRLLRHMPTLGKGRIVDLTGMDYDHQMIDWCKAAFPKMAFYNNSSLPPTCFKDATFDVVYSFSVFTHLSKTAHHQWLAEISRIIKPGGLFIFTTMSNACTRNLLPEEKAEYNTRGLVVRTATREGSRVFATYESPAFVRLMVKQHTILNHVVPDEGIVDQDMWVVRIH